MLATLTTNIAANVVAPANAVVNAAPSRVSFVVGGLITAAIGAAIMPWRLVASSSGFLNFLVAYSVVLGPVVGVVRTRRARCVPSSRGGVLHCPLRSVNAHARAPLTPALL